MIRTTRKGTSPRLFAGHWAIVALAFALVAAVASLAGYSVPRAYADVGLSDATGMTRADFVSYMEEHAVQNGDSPEYYLGAAYAPGDVANPGWGVSRGEGGMSDAGFIWHAIVNAGQARGLDLAGAVPSFQGWSAYWKGANPTGHAIDTAAYTADGAEMGANADTTRQVIEAYHAAVDAGKIRKGDVVWVYCGTDSTPGLQHHVGIYWGDGAGDYRFWHSGPVSASAGTASQFTNLVSPDLVYENHISSIVVIPWDASTSGLRISKTDRYLGDFSQGAALLHGPLDKGQVVGAESAPVKFKVTYLGPDEAVNMEIPEASVSQYVEPYGTDWTPLNVTSLKRASVENGAEVQLDWLYTLDADGRLWASTDTRVLPAGNYRVEEVESPSGYTLGVDGKAWSQEFTVTGENEWIVFDGADESKVADGAVDDVERGDIVVYVTDSELNTNAAQGNATLAGKILDIVNKSDSAVYSPDGHIAYPGDVVCSITTDASGRASTELSAKQISINGWDSSWPAIRDGWTNALAKGEYDVVEASPSKGYLNGRFYNGTFMSTTARAASAFDASASMGALVRWPSSEPDWVSGQGAIVRFASVTSSISDEPARGDISVQRYALSDEGDATVVVPSHAEGSQVTVWNVSRNEATGAPQAIRYRYLDADGEVSYSQVDSVAKADSDLDELASSLVGEDGTIKVTDGIVATGQLDASGRWTTDVYAPKNEDGTYSVNEDGTFAEHAEHMRALPYGTYIVRETAAAEGYGLSKDWYAIVSISEDGQIAYCGQDVNAASANELMDVPVFASATARADLRFLKKTSSGEALSYVPFKLTNTTTSETHIIVTDANGRYDSSHGYYYRPSAGGAAPARTAHTVNRYSNTTQLLNTFLGQPTGVHSTYWFNSSSFSACPAGERNLNVCETWFYDERDGTRRTVDATAGALPVGHYVLSELEYNAPTPDGQKNNSGYNMITDEFDVLANSSGTIDRGEYVDTKTTLLTTAYNSRDASSRSDITYGIVQNGSTVIRDDVEYSGMTVPSTHINKAAYYLESWLVDKATGTAISEHQYSALFKMTNGRGTLPSVYFEMPISTVEGKTVVVYERLRARRVNSSGDVLPRTNDDEIISTHTNVSDEQQSIHYAGIDTEFVSAASNDHVALASFDRQYAELHLIDYLKFWNLKKGSYYVTSEVIDRDTGYVINHKAGNYSNELLIQNDDDEGIFTIDHHMDIDDFYRLCTRNRNSEFPHSEEFWNAIQQQLPAKYRNITYANWHDGKKADGSDLTMDDKYEMLKYILENRTFVATEVITNRVSSGDLAVHADLADEDQAVHFVRIRTQLVDRNTRERLTTNPYTIDRDGTKHQDWATPGVYDVVTIDNIIPNRSYILTGALYDNDPVSTDNVNHELWDVTKTQITGAVYNFKPTASHNVKIDVPFDLSKLKIFDADNNQMSRDFVATMQLSIGTEEGYPSQGNLIGNHHYLDDLNETIWMPASKSNAVDIKTQETHDGRSDQTIKIKDHLTYERLLPGREYTIKTTVVLLDATNPAKVPAMPQKVLTHFTTPTTWRFESGARPVFNIDTSEVTLDVSAFAGDDRSDYTLIIYEDLYLGTADDELHLVNRHKDASDLDQTLFYPRIHTEAFDVDFKNLNNLEGTKGIHIGYASNGEVKIEDTVTYENLMWGHTYTLTAELYKPDGTKFSDLKWTKTFTPEASTRRDPSEGTANISCDGSVVVPISFSGLRRQLEGQTLVIHETLTSAETNNKKVLDVHQINDDPKQTIHYPKIRTDAFDDGTQIKEGNADNATYSITDYVSYWNVIPGYQYRMTATLYDLDALLDGAQGDAARLRGTGNPVASQSATFIPTAADSTAGTRVAVTTTWPKSLVDMHDRTAVVYEIMEIKDATQAKYQKCGSHEVPEDDPSWPNDLGADSEKQIIRYCKVTTTALDVGGGPQVNRIPTHLGYADGDITIEDDVRYRNLYLGDKYYVTSELHYLNADGSDGGLVTVGGTPARIVDQEFTAQEDAAGKTKDPHDANSSVKVTFHLTDSSKVNPDLHGKTLVAYQWINKNPSGRKILLGEHTDIQDPEQANHYPWTASELKDGVRTLNADNKTTTYTADSGTDGHDGYAGNRDADAKSMTIRLSEVIDYVNLIPGLTYRFDGELRYQDGPNAGQVITDANGPVTASVEFKAPAGAETQQFAQVLNYSITGIDMRDRTAVSYVTLYQVVDGQDKTLDELKDIDKTSQSVHYPLVVTTATDQKTTDHIGLAESTITVVDVVELSNLVGGETYKLDGVMRLRDQSDNTKIKTDNLVTQSITFVAEGQRGKRVDTTKTLTFTYNYSTDENVRPENTTYNISETLKNPNDPGTKLVGLHDQIEDEEQTVHYPRVFTRALDEETGYHEGLADGQMKVYDTVKYFNVIPNRSYKMIGTLYRWNEDKTAVEPAKNDDGTEIKAIGTFNTNGRTEDHIDDIIVMHYTITGDSMVDVANTFVAYEQLQVTTPRGAEHVVGYHKVKEDENQTVHYPIIRTVATDAKTQAHEGWAQDEITINDMVNYTNLVPRSVMITYVDMDEKPQPAYQYTIKGYLMDKEKNEPIVDADGKRVTAEESFTPEQEDGSITLTYKMKGIEMEDRTAVVYEQLFHGEEIIAEHLVLSDEEQSVHYPKVRTEAVETVTDMHMASWARPDSDPQAVAERSDYVNALGNAAATQPAKAASEEDDAEKAATDGNGGSDDAEESQDNGGNIEDNGSFESKAMPDEPQIAYNPEHKNGGTFDIVDTVKYWNLLPGKNYTMRGTLMDRATGKPLSYKDGKDATAETKFTTPPEPTNLVQGGVDGQLDMLFEDVVVPDHAEVVIAVAFQNLFNERDFQLADHEELDEEVQAIHFVEMGTQAKDVTTNSHIGSADYDKKITDTVTYRNLIPGKEYTLRGRLAIRPAEDGLYYPDDESGQVTDAAEDTGTAPDTSNGSASDTEEAFYLGNTDEGAYFTSDSTHPDKNDKNVFPGVAGTYEVSVPEGYACQLHSLTQSDDSQPSNSYDKSVDDLLLDHAASGATESERTGKGELAVPKNARIIIVATKVNSDGSRTSDFNDKVVKFVLKSAALEAGESEVKFQALSDDDADANASNENADGNDNGNANANDTGNANVNESNATDSDNKVKAPSVVTVFGKEYDYAALEKALAQNVFEHTLFDVTRAFDAAAVEKALEDEGIDLDASENAAAAAALKSALPGDGLTFTKTGTSGDVEVKCDVVVNEDMSASIKTTTDPDGGDPKSTTSKVPAKVEKTAHKVYDIDKLEKSLKDMGCELEKDQFANAEAGDVFKFDIPESGGAEPTTQARVTFNGDMTVTVDVIDKASGNPVSGDTTTIDAAENEAGEKIFDLDVAEDYAMRHNADFDEKDLENAKAGDELVFETIPVLAGTATTEQVKLVFNSDLSITASVIDKKTGKPAEEGDGKQYEPITIPGIYDLPPYSIRIETLAEEGKQPPELRNAKPGDKMDIIAHVTFEDMSEIAVCAALAFQDDYTIVVSFDDGTETTIPARELTSPYRFVAAPDGIIVNQEVKFTPTDQLGQVTMNFDLSGLDMSGKTVVVFEDLYLGDTLITSHSDIDDEDQAIHYAKITTTALFDNGTDRAKAIDTQVVNDTITYENLIPGNEYTVYGTIHMKGHNRETGFAPDLAVEELALPQSPVEESGTSDDDGDAGNGSANVGNDNVENEGANADGGNADKGDGNTGEADNADANESAFSNQENAEAQEAYESQSTLQVEKTKLTGAAMKKTNIGMVGDPDVPADTDGTVLDHNRTRVEAIARFTPTSAEGETRLSFAFDGQDMVYTDLVVFEEFYIADNLVAQHSNINDELQTVHLDESGMPIIVETGNGVLDSLLKLGFIGVVAGALLETYRRRRKA